MEKLKNVGRFHRVSMGSNQSEFKAGQLQKKSFNKLTVGSRSHALIV